MPQDITKWDRPTLLKVAAELRQKTKPMIVACNKIDIKGGENNFEKLKQQFPNHFLFPCSAESELALREAAKHNLIEYIPGESNFNIKDEQKLNENQKKALEFIKINVLDKFKSTGIQDVLDKSIFELLQYITIFPGGVNKLSDQYGNVLPDCFLMPHNSTALDFAFRLHTDIGKNFIKAIDVRTKKAVGKDYLLKNREVMEIITSK